MIYSIQNITTMLRKALSIILITVLFVLLATIGFIVYLTINSYHPSEKQILFTQQKNVVLTDTSTLKLLSWNICYGGFNNEMDFLFNNGKRIKSSKADVQVNLEGISAFLADKSGFDVIMLQEVDSNSRRSYFVNEYQLICKSLPDYHLDYCKDHVVAFYPFPVYNPLGRISSGLQNLSRIKPNQSYRITLPNLYKWPHSLLMPSGALLVNRHQLNNNKELIIININIDDKNEESYIEGQMKFIRDFLINEYKKGNYVIAGGDWGQRPPGITTDFHFNNTDSTQIPAIPNDFLPGWQWIADIHAPTMRMLDKPYNPDKSLTFITDFFVISPNIEKLDNYTIHLDFKHSPHNPVAIKVKLLGDHTKVQYDYVGR